MHFTGRLAREATRQGWRRRDHIARMNGRGPPVQSVAKKA
jgi:hypothetical protein